MNWRKSEIWISIAIAVVIGIPLANAIYDWTFSLGVGLTEAIPLALIPGIVAGGATWRFLARNDKKDKKEKESTTQ